MGEGKDSEVRAVSGEEQVGVGLPGPRRHPQQDQGGFGGPSLPISLPWCYPYLMLSPECVSWGSLEREDWGALTQTCQAGEGGSAWPSGT